MNTYVTYPALLLDQISILVNVWNSQQLGHKMVPKVSRGNLNRLSSFPKLLNALFRHQGRNIQFIVHKNIHSGMKLKKKKKKWSHILTVVRITSNFLCLTPWLENNNGCIIWSEGWSLVFLIIFWSAFLPYCIQAIRTLRRVCKRKWKI